MLGSKLEFMSTLVRQQGKLGALASGETDLSKMHGKTAAEGMSIDVLALFQALMRRCQYSLHQKSVCRGCTKRMRAAWTFRRLFVFHEACAEFQLRRRKSPSAHIAARWIDTSLHSFTANVSKDKQAVGKSFITLVQGGTSVFWFVCSWDENSVPAKNQLKFRNGLNISIMKPPPCSEQVCGIHTSGPTNRYVTSTTHVFWKRTAQIQR